MPCSPISARPSRSPARHSLKTSRTIYLGHLFVGRVLLSDSSMRDHPLTPMTDSNLQRVLARQTAAQVIVLSYELVRRGPEAIADTFRQLQSRRSHAYRDRGCDRKPAPPRHRRRLRRLEARDGRLGDSSRASRKLPAAGPAVAPRRCRSAADDRRSGGRDCRQLFGGHTAADRDYAAHASVICCRPASAASGAGCRRKCACLGAATSDERAGADLCQRAAGGGGADAGEARSRARRRDDRTRPAPRSQRGWWPPACGG